MSARAAVLCGVLAGAALLAAVDAPAAPSRKTLRVCADPNNLPFSNQRGEGFENAIARLLARELGAELRYVWWAQRRGFIRNTLKAGLCDVVIGLPAGFDAARLTKPYYRSTYVFVTREDSRSRLSSFDDPALRRLKIGVQVIGDDYANTPPVHALSRRGLVDNIVGFTVYGDYSRPNPPLAVLDALQNREIDVAVVWGPLAGYYAKHSRVKLVISPVSPASEGALPFTFEIAMGVRKADAELAAALDRILVEKREEIDRLLGEQGVPRI